MWERSVILPYKHKTYYGLDDGNSASVFVSKAGQKMAPLPLRLDIVKHSPTGFGWGYSGRGPAQLAVAILADWTGCDHAARALHQRFKATAIAGLPEKHWSLTDDDLVQIFETMCKGRPWRTGWRSWRTDQLFQFWTGMQNMLGNL